MWECIFHIITFVSFTHQCSSGFRFFLDFPENITSWQILLGKQEIKPRNPDENHNSQYNFGGHKKKGLFPSIHPQMKSHSLTLRNSSNHGEIFSLRNNVKE
jgi:hypothetical protein